jgi:pimeloyl-ACP methyl ester carboxylesterase
MTTTVYTVKLDDAGPVDLTVDEQGAGRPFLLLHGGGGPATVAGFAALLAGSRPARVLSPTHPGFGGTPRPEALHTVAGLARLYLALLDQLDLDDVTVVGNSIGGWIAAEMALLASPRVSGITIVNGVGIVVPGHPVADFFSLTMDQVAKLSYHDPDRFGIDPATLPPPVQAAMAGNRATLAVYAGTAMNDPTLAGRLSVVRTPTRVLWGDSDQIVDPGYGRAFAAAIPSARFQLLTDTGHMPQLETPDQLLQAIWPS